MKRISLYMDGLALYEGPKREDWNFGIAVAASVGYELIQKKNYALDLNTRLHLANVSLENDQDRDGVVFSIGLGFNWY